MDVIDLTGFQLCHADDKKADQSILREKRVSLGLTQKQVAEGARISFVAYHRFESGEQNIRTASFQLVCRVLEALEMDINDFYHGEYVFGEKVCSTEERLRYQRTCRLIEEDITENT